MPAVEIEPKHDVYLHIHSRGGRFLPRLGGLFFLALLAGKKVSQHLRTKCCSFYTSIADAPRTVSNTRGITRSIDLDLALRSEVGLFPITRCVTVVSRITWPLTYIHT